MTKSFEVVICGAGIAGISTAFFLARRGIRDILLLDELPPLELTSSRSTECYRNWWPDAAMVGLMNRSIDLLEELARESANVFRLNRRGYVFLTADEGKIPALLERARRASSLGAGDLRSHRLEDHSYQPSQPDGYEAAPTGADLLLGEALILREFPGVTERAVAALHVRRAGWLSAQQLGMYLLDSAREMGATFHQNRVTALEITGGRVSAVKLADGDRIETRIFVNAAGPYLRDVGNLAGVALPVHTDLHLKAAFKDTLVAIDRNAPLLIWDDEQLLPWESEEREALSADESTRWLTERFPPGAHARPEGGSGSQTALMLWEYHPLVMEPVWPPPLDPNYPEVVLRGLSSMIPGLGGYFGRLPRPQLDGGYYTKTRENRPLVGPMGVEGTFVAGALSGYGIMSACGVGDLLASHICETSLPDYAPAFVLGRYHDPVYLQSLKEPADSGQL